MKELAGGKMERCFFYQGVGFSSCHLRVILVHRQPDKSKHPDRLLSSRRQLFHHSSDGRDNPDHSQDWQN